MTMAAMARLSVAMHHLTGGDSPPAPSDRAIWETCTLRAALGEDADEMLRNAREQTYKCGEIVHDMRGPYLVLVTKGLTRVYCMSPQGRQVTVRYGVPGQVLGLPNVLAPEIFDDEQTFGLQTLSPCRVLHLSLPTFRRIAGSNIQNMWPLFRELAVSLVGGQRLLTHNVFQPIRARVARHMLDLSERRGDTLIVTLSQQDIADAIGSVREVVSRVIVQLRDAGLIRRKDGAYIIVDPARLYEVSAQE